MIKAHGEIAESALIHDGAATFHGLNINTDGFTDVTATVYDGTSGNGKAVWRQTVRGQDNTGGAFFAAQGIAVETGVYVLIDGENCTVNAYYRV